MTFFSRSYIFKEKTAIAGKHRANLLR